MKKISSLILATSLCGLFALTACNSAAPTPVATVAAPSTTAAIVSAGAQAALALVSQLEPGLVSKANASLASFANGDVATACSRVQPAIPFAQAVATVVAPKQTALASQVAAAINTTCANPPTSASATITLLGTLWAGIQAGAKVSS